MWEGQWNTRPGMLFDNVRIKAPNVESCQKVCQSSKRAKDTDLTPECKGWNFDFNTLSCYIFNHKGYMVSSNMPSIIPGIPNPGIHSSNFFYIVQYNAWGYSGNFNQMYAGPQYCP